MKIRDGNNCYVASAYNHETKEITNGICYFEVGNEISKFVNANEGLISLIERKRNNIPLGDFLENFSNQELSFNFS